MITTHTQLLNALIEKYNLRSYLEIGVQSTANNFDKINAPYKVGVDPEVKASQFVEDGRSAEIIQCTSDDYFLGNWKSWPMETGVRIPKYDIVFVDGFHEKEQVRRDFENSLRCLNDNGFILIHDVLPENEEGTRVPRETKQWWGDVYKWACTIRSYGGIKVKTFNIDNGCMLVQKDITSLAGISLSEVTWQQYKEYGHLYMNVTDIVEI